MSNEADLVIKNARLLLESGLTQGGLAVTNGKISSIATDEHLPQAREVIDAERNIVMPGLIDAHAHIHDPEMLGHEDFTTGSRAAAAGGITTVIDMPLVSQVDTPDALQKKVEAGESMSIIDFSFTAGMMYSENVKIIKPIIEEGVAAFKAFTGEPFPADAGVMVRLLSEASEYGAQITVHAEDPGVLREFEDDMEGQWDAPISHSLARPGIAEQLAISQLVDIARKTGGHLHIAHVTTGRGLREIEQGRKDGVMVTTEVCPHHLMFHRDQMNRLGVKSKMNPPLRTKHDKAALWSALLRGTIDITVSDHAPCPIEKKEAGSNDIREAWAGVDGTQMILRVLLSEGINSGRLSYSKLLHVSSRNPARIFGLYPKKGVLRIGSDADLVIVNPTRKEKIGPDMMFSKCGWTLYEGLEMTGAPEMTFVRGEMVFKEDRTTIKPGHGEFQQMGLSNKQLGGTGIG
ncbi:MAG: dihydroorotase family protein [Candidatus Thorarchaeota archaeon]